MKVIFCESLNNSLRSIDFFLDSVLYIIKKKAKAITGAFLKQQKRKNLLKILYKTSIRIILISFFFCISSDAFAGCGDNANPALKTLCDILRLVHGRLGRAFVMVTVIMSAFQFANGGLQWQPLVQMFIGVAMFWAPKTVALFILPQYITGVYGEGYTPDQILSPDEILSCACPDLY